ncbi:hypothetical protein IJ00_26315 (plasmid) [Calothrix sp. 336/3]|nr:hypothetical protein IJ00_26315 [Calothrix sp. 336/3]
MGMMGVNIIELRLGDSRLFPAIRMSSFCQNPQTLVVTIKSAKITKKSVIITEKVLALYKCGMN